MTDQNPWPPDETNKLIRLWAQGVSAGATAKQLTNKTRNAVIGKAKRLGLSKTTLVVVKPSGRTGQAAFRKAVLEAYGSTCCMSGYDQPQVLDAAHILPYSHSKNNDVTNGLCLRKDLHSLFDCGLLSVSNDFDILVSSCITDAEYISMAGTKINSPLSAFDKPSLEFLRWHREQQFQC